MRIAGVAALALALGLLIGALGFADDAPQGEGTPVHPVLFQGEIGERDESILHLNGLTIGADCVAVASSPKLSVWFTTEVDDAMTSTSFGHAQSHYTFGLDDFDTGEQRDLLGKVPNDTSGTFVYSRSDGKQVALNFLADQDAVQGDCVFSGIATAIE